MAPDLMACRKLRQLRHMVFAVNHTLSAARMETATGWRIARVGHLATERRVQRHIRVRVRHCCQQSPRIRVFRGVEQTSRPTQLGDLPDIHYRDPVTEVFDHAQIVRDKQIGQTEFLLQILQ